MKDQARMMKNYQKGSRDNEVHSKKIAAAVLPLAMSPVLRLVAIHNPGMAVMNKVVGDDNIVSVWLENDPKGVGGSIDYCQNFLVLRLEQ